MADKTPTVGPFWRIWLPNRYSAPSLPFSLPHRISVWSIKCDVMFYIGQVMFPSLLRPSACHKLSQIPFDWLGYIWFYAIFVKLRRRRRRRLWPTIYGYTLSPLRAAWALFLLQLKTQLTNKRLQLIKTKQKELLCSHGVWVMLTNDWVETVSGINLRPTKRTYRIICLIQLQMW